jgi:hypothetical protein
MLVFGGFGGSKWFDEVDLPARVVVIPAASRGADDSQPPSLPSPFLPLSYPTAPLHLTSAQIWTFDTHDVDWKRPDVNAQGGDIPPPRYAHSAVSNRAACVCAAERTRI